MNSPLRCSKTLWQTLNAADVVSVNVFAVIRASGGEGDIIDNYLTHISEIDAVGREIRPLVERLPLS